MVSICNLCCIRPIYFAHHGISFWNGHHLVVDFWDIKEGHHNPEFWWKNFNEEFDYDKNIKGHRDFDIPQNVKVELVFDDEPIDIEFRGRKPNEKVKPKMHRTEG